MTEHLHDGLLQALLDREMAADAERETREHLAACPVCRERYAETRTASQTLASALALLDPPARDPAVIPLRPRSAVRRAGAWRNPALARAAAMLLTVAAAASATIPGSPVRDWLAAAVDGGADAGDLSRPAPVAATSVADPAPTAAESGVRVAPLDGAFRVVVTDAAAGAEISARLVEDDRGGVFLAGDPADVRFATAPGSVRVSGVGEGALRVEIPRAAAAASIEVNGRRVVVKDGDQLQLLVPPGDTSGGEILFRPGR